MLFCTKNVFIALLHPPLHMPVYYTKMQADLLPRPNYIAISHLRRTPFSFLIQ
jgi:hypothetical protein